MNIVVYGVGRSGTKAIQLYLAYMAAIRSGKVHINYEPYLWCMCSDENKKNEDCINYFDCNKNYVINKDKKTLENEDLTIYMKCINKFP